ncbi:hypothetical protein C8F01DRAFT_1070785 [Mycena amicta]|nr:hypothetical protein C8F01DRAFT_1070785 [Mycena amicta]
MEEAPYFPPLDETMWDTFQIDDPEINFLREQIGIQDSEELKKHVLEIQAKAYKVYGYPCIRSFSFARLRISRLPAYPQILPLLRERPDALGLDLGCCFGTDLRKLAADGFPAQNLIGCDLRQEFWDYGHELFRSTPETLPIKFLAGDIFDLDFFAPGTKIETPPTLSTLTSLTPLNKHLSVIHVSYLFHLFSEEKQLELARILEGLLSPEPGSLILGAHVSREVKGMRARPFRQAGVMASEGFCHSAASWVEMWESVFPEESVRAEAILVKRGDPGSHPADMLTSASVTDAGVLKWSCTRL